MNYGMDYQGGDAYGGGGGFETGGDAYGAASSQGGGGGSQGGNRRNYDEQTIIPVTARMILTARPDDSNQVVLEDDRKVYHVKLVGAIRGVEEASTSIQYEIEDGTGLVEVKQWTDDNACTAQQEIKQQVMGKDNTYVKIVAQLKCYQGKIQVVADSVRLLSTGNQLTHHFLEVVYSGEKYKNTSTIVQPHSPMMGISNTGGVGFGGSSGRTPLMAQSGGGGGGGGGLQNSILNFIQQNGDSNEYGVSIQSCFKTFPQHSEGDIRNVIDNLQGEGLIYSTINEENFKTAV